ncbi:MAG: MATE family efflux transporter [Thermoplasmata archaeon]|nr:MAG: MATE family efflux transporter [Thermoplasmata archaeon]
MMIAMSVQTIYNFVDALWVSGFGSRLFTAATVMGTGKLALAAIGFVLPFYMMAVSISTGIGVGGSSAVSRRIGARDKEGADNVAIHSIIITLLISVVYTIIFYLFADEMFEIIGAGGSLELAISYGRIIFGGSIIIFFINIATALLRGEGDAKRAMYALVFGAGLNIILDPIFIFTFKLGVAGAAYATILSMFITSLILIYWLFFRKDTYVSFRFKDFKFKKEILKDIFRVGFPASIQQLSMSFTMLILNYIIVNIALAGDNGVAVYSTGWRVVTIAILPLLGLATATTSVTGATYGEKNYKKLDTAFLYSVKFGLTIEILIALFIFLLAPYITTIFTTGRGSSEIAQDLENFIKISCLFYPTAAFGIASSAMFQGTGKGTYALLATSLRTIILMPILGVFFCCLLLLGLNGIWWGIVVANLTGSVVSFSWAKLYIHRLKTQNITQPVIYS